MPKWYRWLVYITNNDKRSHHEAEWDIAGFILATITLIIGFYLIKTKSDYQWAPFLLIEYLWYVDNMRNNRNY